jgi:ubiquinone/menaquinone biosynthesis C-methylase UbiE
MPYDRGEVSTVPNESPATPATYFTGLAGTYARHRPGYPNEAIEFILESLGRPLVVADIGCGTGISTRLFAREGIRVIGIDPNDDMLREAMRADHPGREPITYQNGRAEATGLAPSSCDVVVGAQAFHWFEEASALCEFHRVLRAGGRLALLWNVKDERDAFTAAYLELTHEAQAMAEQTGVNVPRGRRADPSVGGWFHQVRRASFPNPQALDRRSLLGRARSASYFPRREPERSAMERSLIHLFERHARDGRVSLAQSTQVTLADRADR